MFLCYIASIFRAVAGDCRLAASTGFWRGNQHSWHSPYVINCRGISARETRLVWTRFRFVRVMTQTMSLQLLDVTNRFFLSTATNAPKRRTVSRSVSCIVYSFPVGRSITMCSLFALRTNPVSYLFPLRIEDERGSLIKHCY